jgi:two-component system phosphate regulon sensor histidine kinase PhoR
MFGTLRRLVSSARALARGEGQPIELGSSDELGMLAGSFNLLAEELERALGKLVQERNRLETVLEGMSDAIFTLDYKQRVRMYNQEAQELLGFSDAALKQPLSEVVSVPPLLELVGHGVKEVTSSEFDMPGLKPRRVQVRATPLRAAGETLVVLTDVTEVRRLETIRKDFVANVSHELRTPISVIQANSETLLDGAMEDRDFGRSFVEAIHRNSERLSRLISELLDLSRIEARRYPMTIEPLSVRRAAGRVVDIMSQAVNDKAMQVQLTVPEGLQVMADSKALDQVLFNLLDNAVKYTPEGGHISVRAEATPGNVRIEVQDDGPGIAPRHRARIFERFYRIDPGRSRDMGGTGLGLAIVKHLVDAMRGNIGVRPGERGGSLFWVTLPLVGDRPQSASTGAAN